MEKKQNKPKDMEKEERKAPATTDKNPQRHQGQGGKQETRTKN